jgi:hypothetical protein
MSKRRKNAGEGYGYMFSGAFAKKSDAEKKERTRKGSFIKGVYVNGQHRYAVMTPRTNPIKRKKKPAVKVQKNPTELLVMGANPSPTEHQELTVPAGSTTITIRMNPTRPNWMGSAKASIDRGAQQRRDAAYDRQQKARSKAVRAFGDPVGDFYAAQAKRTRKRGPASRTFHDVFGRNNPVCGHMIGGEPCSRKPNHRGPHLPQGATMRTQTRLRKGWRPNPSAAAIRSSFTGKDADTIQVYDEPHMPAGDYAQLGELLALYVKPGRGGQVQQITFPKGARPIVVADETARQIYIVGGDQNLTRSLEAFGVRDRGPDLFELGEARRIDYKQRKEHVSAPEQDEWRHEFGEDTDVRPVLLYDAARQRLLLEGGEYEIRSEGIIN